MTGFLSQLFSAKPAAPAASQAAPQTSQGAPAQSPQAQATPDVQAPAPQGLDQYSNLWKTQAPAAPQPSVLDVDQSKIVEGVTKINFTSVVPPELMQKATSGGPEAQAAMLEAMNRVAQATTAQQQAQQAEFLKSAFAEMKTSLMAEVRNDHRRTAALDGVRADNPVFAHPATQPIMDATVSQLTKQHPNASAQEIQRMAKDYVLNFASAIVPKAESNSFGFSTTQKMGDQNWASWADTGKF